MKREKSGEGNNHSLYLPLSPYGVYRYPTFLVWGRSRNE
jgi:hypothetical protein